MTYLSIVHGAKGIVYFSYDYRPGPMATTHPEIWRALRDLATELNVNGPIALSSLPRNATVVKTGCSCTRASGTSWQSNCANASAGEVGFTIQSLNGPVEIETMFENRSEIQSRASWIGKFDAYTTHLYRIIPQKQ